jgi:hypothetical protein
MAMRSDPGAIPDALKNFDSLPDAANVRLPVVKGLYSCSGPTVWRNVRRGIIPAPEKHSPGCTTWNVGKLRRALEGRTA